MKQKPFYITCMKCGDMVSEKDAIEQKINYGMPAYCDCKTIGLDYMKGSENRFRFINVDYIEELQEDD